MTVGRDIDADRRHPPGGTGNTFLVPVTKQATISANAIINTIICTTPINTVVTTSMIFQVEVYALY